MSIWLGAVFDGQTCGAILIEAADAQMARTEMNNRAGEIECVRLIPRGIERPPRLRLQEVQTLPIASDDRPLWIVIVGHLSHGRHSTVSPTLLAARTKDAAVERAMREIGVTEAACAVRPLSPREAGLVGKTAFRATLH